MTVSLAVRVKNMREAQALVKRIETGTKANLPTLLTEIARLLRDVTRNRMNTHDNNTWVPASKWVRAKTNAQHALEGQSGRVNFRVFGDRAEVFFNSPGNWTLDQHEAGFTVPPTGQRVTIPLQNPGALGLPSSARAFSFLSRRQSVVPKRRMWATRAEAEGVANRVSSKWIELTIRKSI